MSIRDQLAAKAVRRCEVPVVVSDASADYEILQGAVTAHAMARDRGEDTTELAAKVDEAQEAVRSHWVRIELHALPKADWNSIATAHHTDDGLDWPKALPLLLAESCADEDLRDADYWAIELAKDCWSQGDVAALQYAVYTLNVEAADPVPKG